MAGFCLFSAPSASSQADGTIRAIGGSGYALATVDRVAAGVGRMTVVSGQTELGSFQPHAVYREFGGVWERLGGAFESGEPGVNGDVLALAISPGGVVHAAGSFRQIDGRAVSTVARWNGSEWRQMGSGLEDGAIHTLRFAPDGELYAVYRIPGTQATQNRKTQRILKWVGNTWEQLGDDSLQFGPCDALGFGPNDAIYACSPYFSRWDGSAWVSPTAVRLPEVNDILVTADGTVHAFGTFQEWDGRSLNGSARFVGGTWERMGLGLEGGVYSAVLAADGSIYAGGRMGTRGLTRWTGSAWQQLEGGDVYIGFASLAARPTGEVVAGGSVRDPAPRVVAREYTSAASADLTAAFDAPVRDLAVADDGSVLVAGDFTTARDTDVDYAARWRDGSWSALPSVPIRSLDVIAAGAGDTFYTAGFFSQNSTQRSYAIYEVDSGGSTEIGGTVVSGSTSAYSDLLVAADGALLVTGRFDYVYTASGRGVARWDGTFDVLGEPTEELSQGVAQAPDGTVYALAGNGLLRFTGTNWESLGQADGVTDDVHVAPNGDVYVGGQFTEIGGVGATDIARWSGGTWAALSDGPGWRVREIRTDAAGAPTACGGGIARWNGTAWITEVEIGAAETIFACDYTPTGDLVFGGDFAQANEISSPYIAMLESPGLVGSLPDPGSGDVSLTLAPNPSSGSSTALLTGLGTPATITLHDALGRRIAQVDVGAGRASISLPTADLAPGVYMVRLASGDSVATQRLVVTR